MIVDWSPFPGILPMLRILKAFQDMTCHCKCQVGELLPSLLIGVLDNSKCPFLPTELGRLMCCHKFSRDRAVQGAFQTAWASARSGRPLLGEEVIQTSKMLHPESLQGPHCDSEGQSQGRSPEEENSCSNTVSLSMPLPHHVSTHFL